MLIGLIGYLWSVPIALFLSSALNWQYDGDLGWWIVTAYASPVLFLAEPFGGSVSNNLLAAMYFVVLIILTVAVARSTKLSAHRSDGS